mmetsp:Transcript_23081/g.41226  ORF Transcript_23081/g.41226 Transcript_23081/m.41226 type:complete len:748 (+) Transcript_23081:1367-3610(+)
MRTSAVQRIGTLVSVTGNTPAPRFGHTITAVSKTKVVLFGGAIGDTGRYSIVGDTFSYDCLTRTWTKIEGAAGAPPTPRAAHASSTVEAGQLVVYGGATGGGSLASDDLFLLDLREGEANASWMIVPVVGVTPGRRYGHSMVYIKPNLLVFAGNIGSESVSDVWRLNVERAPFSWAKLELRGEQPVGRVYHSAAPCLTGSASGMMVIFGGRAADQNALNDTWGLRQHRDGRWDWVKAPCKSMGERPSARYQHSSLFCGASLMIIGGRTNQVEEVLPLEVYDTENSEWHKFPPVNRFRHSSWAMGAEVCVYGGFEHEMPNIPNATILSIDCVRLFSRAQHLLPRYITESRGDEAEPLRRPLPVVPRTTNRTPDIRIATRVVVAMPGESDYSDMKPANVQNVPLDRLQEEGKRIGVKALPPTKDKAQSAALYDLFLTHLLRPADEVGSDTSFSIRKDLILALIEECQRVVLDEPVVKYLRAPIKIFGSLLGQYQDLLRYFETWGEPSEKPGIGDIESFDYLFLGDYVDLGTRSLETICLLMALKTKHSSEVTLLRGRHEDRRINIKKGLADECRSRLNEDIESPDSVYSRLNALFECLPLAAVLENRILCVHSGIGSSAQSLTQVDSLQRPIDISRNETMIEAQVAFEFMWSEVNVSSTSSVVGINPIPVSQSRALQFLSDHRLTKLIRTQEFVSEGITYNGDIITICSCTNYSGRGNNSGVMLILKRSLELVTKLLPPGRSAWLADSN